MSDDTFYVSLEFVLEIEETADGEFLIEDIPLDQLLEMLA